MLHRQTDDTGTMITYIILSGYMRAGTCQYNPGARALDTNGCHVLCTVPVSVSCNCGPRDGQASKVCLHIYTEERLDSYTPE